jgi:hypothetical protein
VRAAARTARLPSRDDEDSTMSETKARKIEVANQIPIWLIGWLFTIGYCGLDLVRALFAIVLWPYYLGSALAA